MTAPDDNDRLRAGEALDPFADTEAVLPPSGPAAPPGAPRSSPWAEPIPFETTEVPRFPVEALPRVTRAWAEATAVATQTPVDLAGLLGLAVLAAAVAKRLRVRVRDGWDEPLNLYVVIAMPPGSRKSTVFGLATRALFEVECEEARRMAPEILAAEVRMELAKERRKKAVAAAAKASVEEAQVLALEAEEMARRIAEEHVIRSPRIIADDVTPEKIVDLMQASGGRLGVFSAEAGLFDIIAGRYNERGSANLEVFLKGHSGDPLTVDRMQRASESVQSPALTLGLTVQPHVVRGLARDPALRGRGLLARILFSLPRSNVGFREIDPSPVPPEVESQYSARIKALRLAPCSYDKSGEITADLVHFTAEARERFRPFEEEVERELRPEGVLGPIADWGGKLSGAVARIAGLIAVAESDGGPTVTPEHVERAIGIGRYLISHALAAFALMGADPALEDAKHILAWLRRDGRRVVSCRDIHQGNQGRFKKVDPIKAAIVVLEERGFLRLVPTAGTQGPGRPRSPAFEVHPSICGDN